MPIKTDIAGKGLKYPFTISGGNVQMQPSASPSEFQEAINQRISHIFGVLVGERSPRRNWGSYLKTQVFKPAETDSFNAKVKHLAKKAVEDNEQYIYLGSIEVDPPQGNGVVNIQLTYGDLNTNQEGSLAYPFSTRSPLNNLNIER